MSENGIKTGLNFTWVKSALEKRQANFSNIVCFETTDPVRYSQVKAYLFSAEEYRDGEIYFFEPWTGLKELERKSKYSGYFRPASRHANEGYDPSVKREVGTLEESLRFVDQRMRSKKTVVILQGLDGIQNEDKSQALIYALRAWAHDGELTVAGSVVVLLCGDASRVLDSLTRQSVSVSAPELASEAERAKIIDEVSVKLGAERSASQASLVEATAGLNLHQLKSLLVEAYHRNGGFPMDTVKNLKAEHINTSNSIEIQEPASGFDSVGGYDAVKRYVKERFVRVLEDRERAEKLVTPLPRGMLLFGPPGTGKSIFARALARETNLNFVILRTENIYTSLLGGSGHNLRDAIAVAEQMGALVFIDEIDKLGSRSASVNDGASQETRRVFNQMLEWLQEPTRRAILVGATNRPDDLDEAFTRPGRMDRKIPFLYPGVAARRQIFEIHLGLRGSIRKPPFGFPDSDLPRILDELAEKSAGFTGAEIEQVVIDAKSEAFSSGGESVLEEHLTRSLAGYRIDGAERERDTERYLAYAERHCNDKRFLEELRRER